MVEKINITLVKSMIGRPEKHRKVSYGGRILKLHSSVHFPEPHPIQYPAMFFRSAYHTFNQRYVYFIDHEFFLDL